MEQNRYCFAQNLHMCVPVIRVYYSTKFWLSLNMQSANETGLPRDRSSVHEYWKRCKREHCWVKNMWMQGLGLRLVQVQELLSTETYFWWVTVPFILQSWTYVFSHHVSISGSFWWSLTWQDQMHISRQRRGQTGTFRVDWIIQ